MGQQAQPFKFKLVRPDGSTVEGGAESRALCIAHLEHVKACEPSSRCYYLGKYGRNASPLEIG